MNICEYINIFLCIEFLANLFFALLNRLVSLAYRLYLHVQKTISLRIVVNGNNYRYYIGYKPVVTIGASVCTCVSAMT